ncbi:hypothetical protein MMC31_004592 [Peltigera leucophlebia]|nr:hypothetical protein [Peltigera leucophlebia]
MTVGTTMDITMALGSFFRFISLVLLLVPATSARYLIEGASTTSPGLMPVDGISPRPTRAPEWNGGLNELRRRADNIISSALPNWCGFIEGDYAPSATSAISSSRTPSTTPSTTSSISSSRTSSTTPSTPSSIASSATLGSTSLTPSTSPPKTIATTIVTSLNPSTPPTKTIATTIVTSLNPSTIATSIINPDAITSSAAPIYTTPAARLPTRTVAGIGLGAGLLTSGAIAGIAFFLWRKRKRAPTNPDGHYPDIGSPPILGGTGPMMAQTNNNMAQGYQNAAHPGSQYVPKSQPPDLIKVPEQPANPPHYSPAPIYTSGQDTSPPLIPHHSDNRTSNLSQYPSPASTPLPLLPTTTGNSPAELHDQRASTTTSLRDYPLNSPIFEIGPGEAAAGNFSTPRNYAHEVPGVVPAYSNNARSSAQPLQGIHEAPNQMEPRYEAYSPVMSASRSSTNYPTPTHTRTQAHGAGGQAFASGEGSPVGQQPGGVRY